MKMQMRLRIPTNSPSTLERNSFFNLIEKYGPTFVEINRKGMVFAHLSTILTYHFPDTALPYLDTALPYPDTALPCPALPYPALEKFEKMAQASSSSYPLSMSVHEYQRTCLLFYPPVLSVPLVDSTLLSFAMFNVHPPHYPTQWPTC